MLVVVVGALLCLGPGIREAGSKNVGLIFGIRLFILLYFRLVRRFLLLTFQNVVLLSLGFQLELAVFQYSY